MKFLDVTELIGTLFTVIALVHPVIIAGNSCLHLAWDGHGGIDINLRVLYRDLVERLIIVLGRHQDFQRRFGCDQL